jgi:hypothetical protein
MLLLVELVGEPAFDVINVLSNVPLDVFGEGVIERPILSVPLNDLLLLHRHHLNLIVTLLEN